MNKTGTHAFVNQLLVYTLVMICFSGSIGLGTVWMQQQIARTSNSIKQLETRAGELERRRGEITSEIASEESPAVLERQNRELRLGLVQPKEHQIERIYEQPERRLAAKRNSELLTRESPVSSPVRYFAGGAH